jgi:hypothetical protein
MAIVNVEAQLSYEELLRAIEQLSHPELEELIQRALALQAQRRSPSVSPPEAELLLRINQTPPAELQRRYDELIAKRRAETLKPDEHAELIRLTDEMEGFEARRLEAMSELARLKRTSLPALMESLGIRSPEHG